MKNSGIEAGLIEYCAPTLAGMKSAGLFNYFYKEKSEALRELCLVNEKLNRCGVYVETLSWKSDSVLIYAYRPRLLQTELSVPEVGELLEEYGYADCNICNCICRLKQRLAESVCFPHEIGVFLGYNLEDVKGFIDNDGKNCKACGLWKVYCNEGEKEKLFEKFNRCTRIYTQLFCEGRQLSQLTVMT